MTPYSRTPAVALSDLIRIEDIRRRDFMSSAFAAALLIACGDGEDEAPAADEPTTRLVSDRYGQVQVPANPSRVVSLERVTLYHCLALGVQPLATTVTGTRTLAELQPDWLDVRPRADIQILDEVNLDLEAVAKLTPDLMVTYLEHKSIAELRNIAPVVAPKYNGSPDWKNLFNGIAQALNKEKEAAVFVKRYEDRVAKFRRETLPKMQGKTVSAIRVRSPTVSASRSSTASPARSSPKPASHGLPTSKWRVSSATSK